MKNDKGLTLVELIIAMGIMSLIFLVSGSFLMFGSKTHKKTSDEFEIQSIVRILAADISNSIRKSTATFTLYKTDDVNFSDKWNYIMVSKDKKRVVSHKWNVDQKQHIQSTIMDEVDGATFRIEFTKNKNDKTSNLLNFKIIANINGQERVVDSGLEGLNTLQIIDKPGKHISNTIAYRLDSRPTGIAQSQAAVAMVLDRSGSMARNMNSEVDHSKTNKPPINNMPVEKQRIFKLQKEANSLLDNLAKNSNIYISLHPFSSHANGYKDMVPAKGNTGMIPAKGNTEKKGILTDTIDSMKAEGGTNTGDGMRRAYHSIRRFNETKNMTKNTKNFMIILVDGVTTFSSVHQVTPINYIIGDNNIGDTWLDDSRYYKSFYKNGVYYGAGSSLDTVGTNYVTLIGNMIKNYKSTFGEGIKVYVIGFTNVKEEKDSLNAIVAATSNRGKSYEAGDEEALRDIFELIQRDINDSLWHIGGPS